MARNSWMLCSVVNLLTVDSGGPETTKSWLPHHSFLFHFLSLGTWICLQQVLIYASLLFLLALCFLKISIVPWLHLPLPKIHLTCKVKCSSKTHSRGVLISKLQTFQHYHRQILLLKMPLNIDSFTWLRKLPFPHVNSKGVFPTKPNANKQTN